MLTTKATYNQKCMIKGTFRSVHQPLQRGELQHAENILWKQAQFESFPDEMSALTANFNPKLGRNPEKIERSSTLFKLSPHLDANGVMRMSGRLAASDEIPVWRDTPCCGECERTPLDVVE